MPQQNVENVRRAWEVFIEGIPEGDLGAAFDMGLFASTSTFTPAREMPNSKTCVGRDEFVQYVQAWIEDFMDWKIWPEEIIDAGDDHVVAILRQSAKGKGSGAPVQVRFGAVYTLEGNQVIDQRQFLDPAEAFEAAGLSEQDAHGLP